MAVLAAAVLFTTVGTALLSRSAKETDSRNADLVTLRLSSDLQRLVSAHSALIAGLRSLYRLNQDLSPEQFRDFVAGSRLLDAYPGAQALEFARRSPARPDARTPSLDGMSPLMNVVGTGDPDVPARPDPAAGDAWVVEYVEPVSGNEAALGLDLGAETARREAIEEACRRNRPAATSPIRLVQDRSSATGFVVVAPVYQSDPAPMTPEARYEQCTGVMVVVYRASEVLSMVTAEEAAEFEVYDIGPPAAVAGSEPARLDSLLFDTDGKSAAGGRPVKATHPRGEIDFHGRRWEILVTDVGAGRGGVASSVWAAAAFGVPFSALVSGLALQLAASRRRALARGRLVAAGDSDRRSLERDLHDGAQQRLLAASLALRRAHAELKDQPRAVVLLGPVCDELARSLEELRELARGLHPSVLSNHGLAVAVESVAARAPMPVDLRVNLDDRPPPPVEAAAYYVVCEALANATRHSQATRVAVSIDDRRGRVTVDVRDDGVGTARMDSGSGLRGLCDRVEALDGRLTVLSPPGRGTWIQARIPYDRSSSRTPQ